MYKTIPYTAYSEEMLKQLPKGAFMTVKNGDEINTIVIGWGHIGFIWGKKTFVAYIRYSRYTYELLKDIEEFTISVPLERDLRKELAFCGTKSGRDVNKFEACNLTPIKGRAVDAPIIGECERHYECQIMYRQAMDDLAIINEVNDRYYPQDDYHMIYYGEIVDSYIFNKDGDTKK